MASSTQIISKEQLEIQQKYADQVQAYWTARGIQPTAWLDTYGCQHQPQKVQTRSSRRRCSACDYVLSYTSLLLHTPKSDNYQCITGSLEMQSFMRFMVDSVDNFRFILKKCFFSAKRGCLKMIKAY